MKNNYAVLIGLNAKNVVADASYSTHHLQLDVH